MISGGVGINSLKFANLQRRNLETTPYTCLWGFIANVEHVFKGSLFIFYYLFSLFRHLKARDQKNKAKHTLKVEEGKDFNTFQGKTRLQHS